MKASLVLLLVLVALACCGSIHDIEDDRRAESTPTSTPTTTPATTASTTGSTASTTAPAPPQRPLPPLLQPPRPPLPQLRPTFLTRPWPTTGSTATTTARTTRSTWFSTRSTLFSTRPTRPTRSTTTKGSTASTASTTTRSTVFTASTTTAKPVTVTRQPQVVAVFKVEITNANGNVIHKATQLCSGTIVSSQAVLTTASCAKRANSTSGLAIRILTNKYEATNKPDIPTDDYYQVKEVEVHPEYDAVKNERNLAILKMGTDIEYIDNQVSVVGWVESPAPINTQCIASFWSTKRPNKQVNMNAQIVACADPTNTMLICADITKPATRRCQGGEDGTSLICNGRIAGMLSATTDTMCNTVTATPFNELSSDKKFLWDTVNAAPLVHFSATAFFAMLVVMLKNYC